jgi:hypothetical protein
MVVDHANEGTAMTTTTTTPPASRSGADTYREADERLRTARDEWRQEEADLMATRDRQLRQMVGTARGGVTATARALGVSDAQILRMLDEGITRVARRALDGADIERADYQLTHQRGGRSIGVVLVTDAGPSEGTIIAVMERVGLVLRERRSVSNTANDALRWAALKRVRQLAAKTLIAAGVSARTYRLADRRGEETVSLTCTPFVSGFCGEALSTIREILTSAGLVVTSGGDDTLRIGTVQQDDDQVSELLFTWEEQ